MASSPGSSGPQPAAPHEEEEAATDEPQQSRRQQKREKMRLQQKKKSGSGAKGDKGRRVDSEDVNERGRAVSGEDESPKDETNAAVSQDRTSATEATIAGEDQHDTNEGEEDQPSPSKTAAPSDGWDHDSQPPITGSINVIYCGVCGMPPDYCEFGTQWKRCKAWLEQHHPELLPYALPPEELTAAKEASADPESSNSRGTAAESAAPDGAPSDVNSSADTSDPADDLVQQLAENLRLSAAATQEAAAALGLDAAEDISTDALAAGVKKKAPKGKAAAQPAVVSIQRQSRAKRKTMTVIVGLDFFGVKLPNATKIFSKRFACGASVSKNPLGHPPQQVEVQGDVEEAIVEVIESVFNIPSDKIVLLPRK